MATKPMHEQLLDLMSPETREYVLRESAKRDAQVPLIKKALDLILEVKAAKDTIFGDSDKAKQAWKILDNCSPWPIIAMNRIKEGRWQAAINAIRKYLADN